MNRMKVTSTSKAAKAFSASHPGRTVWYFRRGNNEGFVMQGMKPRPQDVGFSDWNGYFTAGYMDGRKFF